MVVFILPDMGIVKVHNGTPCGSLLMCTQDVWYTLWVCNIFCGKPLVNPLKPELNPICYLLALLGAHHFLHVSRIRVKLLTLR